MRTVTRSELACYAECPKKHRYQYLDGRVRVVESTALALGRVYHGAMEAWWGSGRDSVALLMETARGAMDPYDYAKVSAMVKTYNPVIPKLTNIEPERELEIRVPGIRGVRYRCKLDLLAKENGEVVIGEWKTTSDDIDGYGAYWIRLMVDSQVLWYCNASGARKVYYGVARKPGVRPRKEETPEEFEARCIATIEADYPAYHQFRPLVFTDDEVKQAAVEMHEWARRCVKEYRWPRNTSACRNLYGVCQYLDVCSGRALLSDDGIFRSKLKIHEEME